MRAGDGSSEKFLMLCSTPLSKREISFEAMGAGEPSARLAVTFSRLEASLEGCARRPACAARVPINVARVTRKTSARHPLPQRRCNLIDLLGCGVTDISVR